MYDVDVYVYRGNHREIRELLLNKMNEKICLVKKSIELNKNLIKVKYNQNLLTIE